MFQDKFCVILLLTCATIVNGAFWLGSPSPTSDIYKSSSDFVVNQRKIYALFRHIFSPKWNPTLTGIANEFNVTDMHHYKDEIFPKGVLDFAKSMMKGRIKPLQKNQPFVYHLEPCIKEYHAALELLTHTKDFDTVLETAAWLRNLTNEEAFMYELYTFLIHHVDEEYLLPPPYEVNPYKFFRDDIIRKAHIAKMLGSNYDNCRNENGPVVKYINYDGPYQDGWEGDLAYFREDIDLNAYYYLFRLSFESSLNEEYFENTTRGEIFLFEHQQLLARYSLERFSQDFWEVDPISYDDENVVGYYPLMSHANGFPIIPRPYFYEEKLLDHLKTDLLREEQGLLRLIDLGGIWSPYSSGKLNFRQPDGINFLGNIIEGNTNSKSDFPKFWPTLLQVVSGPKLYRTRTIPMDFTNSFDHHETQLRDHGYFQAIKKIINLIKRNQDHQPPYDFEAKFLNVLDVTVSHLRTKFIKKSIDISNAVPLEESCKDTSNSDWLIDEDIQFKVNLKVLTHDPFYYDLKVHADHKTDAIVRVFLGPNDAEAERIDLYNWDKHRENFFQIDYYFVKLERGENKIIRKSTTFTGFGSDGKSFEEILTKDEDSFTVSSRNAFCSFPERLLLPKSTLDGKDFVMYFVVTPTIESIETVIPTRFCNIGTSPVKLDNWPMGFPFDRKINNEDFLVKNSAIKKITIYHTTEN
ncbi:hypothetical protein DMENIID0001_126620 [Sergentomyia squamirostris]